MDRFIEWVRQWVAPATSTMPSNIPDQPSVSTSLSPTKTNPHKRSTDSASSTKPKFFKFYRRFIGIALFYYLKFDGSNIKLTDERKQELCKLMTGLKLTRGQEDQTEKLSKWFNDLIALEWLDYFDKVLIINLKLLSCGVKKRDIDSWQKNSTCRLENVNSKHLLWFWQFVSQTLDKQNDKLSLHFATRTCRVANQGSPDSMCAIGPRRLCVENYEVILNVYLLGQLRSLNRSLPPSIVQIESLPDACLVSSQPELSVYYVNLDTKATRWDPPLDHGWQKFRGTEDKVSYKHAKTNKCIRDPPLPPGWVERRLPPYTVFYIDHNTRSTHWEPPLSKSWIQRYDPDGKVYYTHDESNNKEWDPPLPHGWERRYVYQYRNYYNDISLDTSDWDPPRPQNWENRTVPQFSYYYREGKNFKIKHMEPPLPRGWEQRREPQYYILYRNVKTNIAQWDPPLESGLSKFYDFQHERFYYLDSNTRTRYWNPPLPTGWKQIHIHKYSVYFINRNTETIHQDYVLHNGWRQCLSSVGEVYYIELKTGKSYWDPPLLPGWEKCRVPLYDIFYKYYASDAEHLIPPLPSGWQQRRETLSTGRVKLTFDDKLIMKKTKNKKCKSKW